MYNTRCALPTAAVCAIAALAAGCVTQYPVSLDGTDARLSAVLVDALGGVVREAIADAERRGEPLPDGARNGVFAEHVRFSIVNQHADALLVTDEQERNFAAGRFADDHNRRAVDRLLDQIAERKVAMTTIERYLAAEREAGGLGGARLELAHRLLRDRFDSSLMGELLSGF